MLRSFPYIASLLIIIFLFYACRKDPIITSTSAKLNFSADTFTFDTVFTTIGSTTKYFKIYNNNNKRINISSIRLAGGTGSQFRINIDGMPMTSGNNYEIAAKDSMYVFVEVTVDPTAQNTPFVILDSIIFETNGNIQNVILMAWGQNAHFFYGTTICDSIWINDKPYVIVNSLLVDSGCTLTIEQGVKVYSSANSGIFVKGTLIVNGIANDSVVFRGIRLEPYYENLPGQWLGIYLLRGSSNNTITHAVVKNALYGVSVGSNDVPDLFTFTWANHPDVIIKNTVIKNMMATGIFGFLAEISAENCLVFNCGRHIVQLAFGGKYDFTHCTFANYGSFIIEHKNPILHISNFAESSQGHFSADIDSAIFTNCILYGSVNEEINLDNDGIAALNYLFENCLLKTELNTITGEYIAIIKNQDPKFVDIFKEDYHLQSTSPAIDAGKNTGVTTDIEENLRDASPDIGAYEWN